MPILGGEQEAIIDSSVSESTDSAAVRSSSTGVASRVVGAVLAAGAGTRYGMPKIIALQGEWLTTAVAALRDGGCDEVLVAMGARIVTPPAGSSALIVDDWSTGLSATVRRVLDAVTERRDMIDVAGVVFHVVDTPDVDDQAICRILAASGRHRQALARATYADVPGHPVYIGVDHFESLRAGLRGDVGAGSYLRGRLDVLTVECGDLATGIDHDSPPTTPD